MATPTPQTNRSPAYVSAGRPLSAPPVTARITTFFDSAYLFIGLYLTTLLSFDSTTAAQTSPFARQNQTAGSSRPRPSFFGGSSGSSGWGGGSGGGGAGGKGPYGGGGGAGKKLGTVDDVRGPECKSCQ